MSNSESQFWCCTREEGKGWNFCEAPGDIPQLLREGKQIWLDILRPSKEDLDWLKETFGFHELALSDVMNNETRPKEETYGDVLFSVFGAINLNPGEEALDTINLNLFLTRQVLVTVHLQPMHSVRQLKEAIEQRREPITRGPDYLFYRLLDGVVDWYFYIFDQVDDELDRLEERVFSGEPDGIQESIFNVKKRIALLRNSLGPKREALKMLVYAEFDQIQKETQTHLRDVLDHVMRMWDMLESEREVINGLMDSHMIQISNRMNEVMKMLSIIATIMLPLSFMTGIFGMNFDYIPGLHTRAGFWVTMAVMLGVAGAMLWWFRRRKII